VLGLGHVWRGVTPRRHQRRRGERYRHRVGLLPYSCNCRAPRADRISDTVGWNRTPLRSPPFTCPQAQPNSSPALALPPRSFGSHRRGSLEIGRSVNTQTAISNHRPIADWCAPASGASRWPAAAISALSAKLAVIQSRGERCYPSTDG